MTDHRVTISSEPSAFERRNGLPPAVQIRCSCGWSSTTLFEDSARKVRDAHLAETATWTEAELRVADGNR